MKFFFLVVFTFLAAGCTPVQWVRADASAAQLEADSAQCRQQAWHEANARAWYYRPFMTPGVLANPLGRTYPAWPYSPFSDPFYDPFLEQGRLASFCMQARGYELLPAGKAPAETIQPS